LNPHTPPHPQKQEVQDAIAAKASELEASIRAEEKQLSAAAAARLQRVARDLEERRARIQALHDKYAADLRAAWEDYNDKYSEVETVKRVRVCVGFLFFGGGGRCLGWLMSGDEVRRRCSPVCRLKRSNPNANRKHTLHPQPNTHATGAPLCRLEAPRRSEAQGRGATAGGGGAGGERGVADQAAAEKGGQAAAAGGAAAAVCVMGWVLWTGVT